MTVFQKILDGQLPSVKLFEDDWIYVFMDAFPQSEGHSLIIPKKAAPDLFSLDAESLQRIALFSQKLARALKKALQADGIKIMQFNGAAAGQTVFHYHMHLIPAWNQHKEKKHHAEQVAIEALQHTAEKIIAALNEEA